MFSVITDHPIAVDSDDHKHPEGIYHDNNYNTRFVESFEAYYNDRKIKFMDLGCAGGELVCKLNERGHTAVGLEGSDHCLNLRTEEIEKIGFRPKGQFNWMHHHKKYLFTCDVTKPFKVLFDNQPIKFDLITCWDVVEHFEKDDIPQFLMNVSDHLEDNGIFAFSFDENPSFRHIKEGIDQNIDYHKTKEPRSWWETRLSYVFNIMEEFPFEQSNRGQLKGYGCLIACTKK